MKHINEYAFWNKDSDIGDKILSKLHLLKEEDITSNFGERDIDAFPRLSTPTYTFFIDGFEVSCYCDKIMVGRLTVDNVKLDIGFFKIRNIYKKIEEIYKSPKIKRKKEEERFIKKDLRITFSENIKKFEDFTTGNDECNICGGPIFGDVCPNCENEDNIPEPDVDIKDKGNKYKDHSHYNSISPATTKSQQNYFM